VDASKPSFDPGRRRFLQVASVALMGLFGVTLAPPLAAAFVGPSLRNDVTEYTPVGGVPSITPGQPTSMQYTEETTDAYMKATEMRNVWVVQASTPEGIQVFSPICPHLGCQYDWDKAAKQFHCPCHGSTFALDGKHLGGPAPRGLDTLPFKVVNNELLVKWESFKLGVAEKVQV
jgi:menaquinol-cytochrome c reductase iron-sulfur subunit